MTARARGSRACFGLAALFIGTVGTSAWALQQPDGVTIPQSTRLAGYLAAEGEPIDPLTEAATTPETFTPQCSLTFSVIARGAGQMNSFGWYNVTGQKPADTELYEFITCSDDIGTSRSLDVRSDSRYAGGEIGFFLATTQGKIPPNCVDFNDTSSTLGYVYYSESSYNPDNALAPGGESFVHLLLMDSKVFPDAFYFGWEDLITTGNQSDNDNDFEDLLMRVEGIWCSGGGEPCDTGEVGICAQGAMQCVNGELTCVQLQEPGTESCNALDDDCNGDIDDGDLCEENYVCFRGECVPLCGSGEFDCPGGLVCNPEGLCVDPDCVDVECEAGEVCVDGECRAACDGVTCPYGQVCRNGVCLEPCEGVTCDSDYVCELGVCVLRCGCTGCDSGESCDDASQLCVETACLAVTCDAGTHCENGTCVDDCDGAVCPPGEICTAGQCVAGSVDGGAGGTGGQGGFGGMGARDGGLVDGSVDGSPDDSLPMTEDGESGCGCRTAGGSGAISSILLGILAALGFALRRPR